MAKPKREMIPQPEVLAWLQQHYPQLHKTAEVERAWVWLVCDLRGDHNKEIREAIKNYGFVFSRHGGHRLPSGNLGTWGHSCERPLPFKRHGKPTRGHKPEPPQPQQPEREPETQELEDFDPLAFAMGE